MLLCINRACDIQCSVHLLDWRICFLGKSGTKLHRNSFIGIDNVPLILLENIRCICHIHCLNAIWLYLPYLCRESIFLPPTSRNEEGEPKTFMSMLASWKTPLYFQGGGLLELHVQWFTYAILYSECWRHYWNRHLCPPSWENDSNNVRIDDIRDQRHK